jgi:NAD(P)-dependent dehydrogenase (short-subunit alcohol dehydrogenase family)
VTTGLVTAATGGIGRAVVERLLADGVVDRVLGVDIAEPATPLPDGAELVRCDLRTDDGLGELAAAVPGDLSVLVNVLGGERQPPLREIGDVAWPPPEVWDDIVDLNLSGVYRLTRLLLPRLVPGSAICNVSSIAATMPWTVSPAYGAAKAALEHWSTSLAVLLAGDGIRVNLVRPGFVWSRQWQLVDRAEFESVVRDRVPLRQLTAAGRTDREQTATDVAEAVAYLCSRSAAHVTGQAVNVDGGAALVRAAR